MTDISQASYARFAQTPLSQAPATKTKLAANSEDVEKSAEKNTSNDFHWRNPTLMAWALPTGLIFALIHHFFYRYWDGKTVLNETQQQWITRGGTFFAFAFKVALAAGGGLVYVQFLWMSLRQRAYKVRDVDSIFRVLSNPLAFRLMKLWLRLPLLAVVAALVCLVAPSSCSSVVYRLTVVLG
jgi:hypothetical protein